MKKTIFYLLYIAIVIYSIAGLWPLARLGGPCGAGLVIVVLGPVIIIISLIHLLIFKRITRPGMKATLFNKILSILCTLFWALWVYLFLIDEIRLTTLYMIPFLILSLTLTLITTVPSYLAIFKKEQIQ